MIQRYLHSIIVCIVLIMSYKDCYCNNGFSGVTSLLLTCSRSTGVNEAIACMAPQQVEFSIDVDGGVDADLVGDVNLILLDAPYWQFTPFFPETNSSGEASRTVNFPDAPIPNTVGTYRFQAWLRQKDGSQKTSNIITIIVYTVRCIKIEAANNQDIYWPNTPNYSDKLWAADPDIFYSNGQLFTIFDRPRVADIYSPATQHYKLIFTFVRRPECQTSQTLSTTISLDMGGSISSETVGGWTPYLWISNRSSVGIRRYSISLLFRVNSVQISTVQQRDGFCDYAIYATPTCPAEKFTVDLITNYFDEIHHYNPILTACTWGEGGTSEITIADNVMGTSASPHFNESLTSNSDICQNNQNWYDFVWECAMGTYNLGACCCRAHGMMQVLQELGISFQHAYVNELAEPGARPPNPPAGVFCSQKGRLVYRMYWASWWNHWEGTCYNGTNGSKHWGPAGYFSGTYSSIQTRLSPYEWSYPAANQNDYCQGHTH